MSRVSTIIAEMKVSKPYTVAIGRVSNYAYPEFDIEPSRAKTYGGMQNGVQEMIDAYINDHPDVAMTIKDVGDYYVREDIDEWGEIVTYDILVNMDEKQYIMWKLRYGKK